MISVSPAGQLSICGKNFNVVNVVTFSDTISMINVKLCMAVVLAELYPFIPLKLSLVSVTLIIIQGCRVVKQF